jgi:hypothetical protein
LRNLRRGAELLLSVMYNLSQLSPAYVYSFSWFMSVFNKTMEASEAEAVGAGAAGGGEAAASSEELLPLAFVHAVFMALLPGVFEMHRHAISVAFALAVMRCRGTKYEVAARAGPPRGASSGGGDPAAAAAAARSGAGPLPGPAIIPQRAWEELLGVCSGLPALGAAPAHICEHLAEWSPLLDMPGVEEFAAAALPAPFDGLEPFLDFQLRVALRRDALPALVAELLRAILGDDFAPGGKGNVELLYGSGVTNATPIVVLAAPGCDAVAAIVRFATEMGAAKRLGVIRCAMVRRRRQRRGASMSRGGGGGFI